MSYNLGFISDEDIYRHVKETVSKYRFAMNLDEFNKNIIDPIKLTFDAGIYRQNIEDIIENEVIRQLDKSNTNHVGYFHQNIFKYVGNGWECPEEGYDVINKKKKIYVEMKNKHNTMNSSAAQKTYMRMQQVILRNSEATCYLVEVIAKKSQDITWVVSLDSEQFNNHKIRRISIDKFYELVTGDTMAFRNLCQVLPKIIQDILSKELQKEINNTVLAELKNNHADVLKALYLQSFKTYEGFDKFEFVA